MLIPCALGVNVDHIASVRQLRQGQWPDPVEAVRLAMSYGVDHIVFHLREDRRHIQDLDVKRFFELSCMYTFECALTDEMLKIAYHYRPVEVCFVPEKREELTTEGGLDLKKHQRQLVKVIPQLQDQGISVGLFIDPTLEQVRRAHALGAQVVELHTGSYAECASSSAQQRLLVEIQMAAIEAQELGMSVHAGHGLNFENIGGIVSITAITGVNIGYSLVCDAIFLGWQLAIERMRERISTYRLI